ncbi:carboxyltransferase domain-containing protein [Brachybacterium sp. YJGR34]|uniref:5-oxoprolinase subunit B/C family protein n=1 Tax=Brachybacterium sp. YJGR34 TaxID=2059911 RepID=UPI000E09E8C8|nr:carboxyltransferase domain-containing protein [Brachybacterium sp. YJGR34]
MSPPRTLPPPRAVHRAGEHALLAEYEDTAAVLAAAAAVEALAPAGLRDLVPAERTLLLTGTTAGDRAALADLLTTLPAAPATEGEAAERTLEVVYDGEDLEELAALLGRSTQSLIDAHSSTTWIAAFGGFAPGFAYLVPEDPADAPGEVPRRAEPRPAVPAGAVGLASRYCGIYPRSSPGGWQLIGRSDAELFAPDREPPALLTPGTRVRFAPQRPTARTASPIARAARGAALRGRRRGGPALAPGGTPVLEVRAPGPLTLLEDAGRPGRAAIGVSGSGVFDRGAMVRANLALGNPSGAAVLETLVGPLVLEALAPAVVAVSGARAPLTVHRRDEESGDLEHLAGSGRERAIALDPGDRLELGPASDGLRLVLAVRGGIGAVHPAGGAPAEGPVLGAMSHDTLSGLGPSPLGPGDVLLAGAEQGLDAVPPAATTAQEPSPEEPAPSAGGGAPTAAALRVPVHPGPRDALLGAPALEALLARTWTVRPDSDRVGVRLDGEALSVPIGAASLPSEAMLPGAIQVPPSGLPVVFGPDHPTTGGYPVIAVVPRAGLDLLGQAAPGTAVRFAPAE